MMLCLLSLYYKLFACGGTKEHYIIDSMKVIQIIMSCKYIILFNDWLFSPEYIIYQEKVYEVVWLIFVWHIFKCILYQFLIFLVSTLLLTVSLFFLSPVYVKPILRSIHPKLGESYLLSFFLTGFTICIYFLFGWIILVGHDVNCEQVLKSLWCMYVVSKQSKKKKK